VGAQEGGGKLTEKREERGGGTTKGREKTELLPRHFLGTEMKGGSVQEWNGEEVIVDSG